MRSVSIGDVHGKNVWKQINPDEYDLIVFMGDYCDSGRGYLDRLNGIDASIEVQNLKEIIGFKKANPEKVILLLGNHDIAYAYYPHHGCSRFRHEIQQEVTALFKENKSLFQVAHQVGETLWTHAGVSNEWLKIFKLQQTNIAIDKLALAEAFNLANKKEPTRSTLHLVSHHRGGSAWFGGITWADIDETKRDFVDGVHQIVGHSRVDDIETVYNESKIGSITYTDCLDTKIKFYEKEVEN